MNEVGKIVDPRLWQVYAGATIHVPLPDSEVCYFPQGHAEQTHTKVNFLMIPAGVKPCILCKVIEVKLLADPEEEEVYAKIMLRPLEYDIDDERILVDTHTVSESHFNFPYFAKKTTPSSDKYLSVRREDAEKVFPPLSDPSDQTLKAKDIHGNIWKFNHTLLNKRHKITSGWSTYFAKKKVKVGDSVVFLQAETGELCVGIRRAMIALIGGGGKVRPEDVIQAVTLAKTDQRFEVTYYPLASTSEFVVKASSVKTALGSQWLDGTRFKMAFETDDMSDTSLFAGTVSSVRYVDPSLWPNSPWHMLQVDWDENQELLQTVKCVSPWQVQVDLVSNNPNTRGARHSGIQIPIPFLFNQNPTDKLDCGNNDLTTGSCSSNVKKNGESTTLFGKKIYKDQQVNHSSDENANELDAVQKNDDDFSDHCKIYFGSENECRGILDLSDMGSYEDDVKETLFKMFEDEKFDTSTRFTYEDSAGVVKEMGDESFREFAKKAKRLTIIRG